MLEILMYIFDKYLQPDIEEKDPSSLHEELESVGFSMSDIRKALLWLSDLADYEADDLAHPFNSNVPSIRVFAPEESKKLSRSCLGFIHFLEQTGVLTPRRREILIERAMALDLPKLNVFQLKWVAFFTLFYQVHVNSEQDISWLESLVFAETNRQYLQ